MNLKETLYIIYLMCRNAILYVTFLAVVVIVICYLTGNGEFLMNIVESIISEVEKNL